MLRASDAYMSLRIGSPVFHVMICDKFVAKPLKAQCKVDSWVKRQWNYNKTFRVFIQRNAFEIEVCKITTV